MKLQRIRIEHFKRFRAPLEIDGLSAGLNLFTAPNESGKSTVAEAIRAAFFERHRSTSLEHLRPWGDSASAPSVALDFVLNGQPGQLSKVFLKKHRCSLQLGSVALDGEEAENHLAGLLGFGFAGRGASKPENMGIPGLLWIEQGSSHHIADSVGHASHHLRNALGESLGELASTSGDAILKSVEDQRNALLTPAGGNPRGDYAEVLKRRDQLGTDLAALHAQIDAYRHDVDRLADLRRQHQHDEQTRPWVATGEALAQARQRLDEAQGLAERKAAKDAAVQQTQAQLNALRAQLDGWQSEEAMRAQRQQQLTSARERLAQAQALVAQWAPRHAQAQQAEAAARAAIRQALQVQDWQNQTQALADLRQRLADKSALLAQAQEAQAQLTQQQAQVQALGVPAAALQQLRADDAALRALQARLDAVATALEFELQPGAHVQLQDGAAALTPPVGLSRQTLIRRTVIEIAGVGRITVLPGGADLDTLAHERERLHDAVARQLQALGADSLAALDERVRQQAHLKAQIAPTQKMLQGLAPKGLAALEAETAALQAQWTRAAATLAQRPAVTDEPTLSVAQAQQHEAQARAEREAAADQWHHAQSAERTAQAHVHSAEAELTALCATLDDPARTQRKRDASIALLDAQARATTLTDEAQALAQQLHSLNLPVLRQDVERLEHSARHALAQHQERATQIARLEAQLQTQGALGLEEAAAELARELGYAERRCAELTRHAQALDHLLQLLRAKRAELARKLRAPLQQHLTHYLQILFPGAQVEVGDDLVPGHLTRPGPRGSEHGEFEALSVGAREQMGVIARLAYADLLQAAGRPTLLILDDALVHTDRQRLSQMKRVLYDAAQRHQILVFSCHPEAWMDLGVAARSLG